MNCPKCGGEFVVTHTFKAGAAGRTQRVECRKCGTVGTATTVLVNVDPAHGEGAKSLAKRMQKPARIR